MTKVEINVDAGRNFFMAGVKNFIEEFLNYQVLKE